MSSDNKKSPHIAYSTARIMGLRPEIFPPRFFPDPDFLRHIALKTHRIRRVHVRLGKNILEQLPGTGKLAPRRPITPKKLRPRVNVVIPLASNRLFRRTIHRTDQLMLNAPV